MPTPIVLARRCVRAAQVLALNGLDRLDNHGAPVIKRWLALLDKPVTCQPALD
jgi:hypothetical protein